MHGNMFFFFFSAVFCHWCVDATATLHAILCVHTKRGGATGSHRKWTYRRVSGEFFARENRQHVLICRATLSPCTGEELWRDKFARVEIFELWREYRVMTANQRWTAWPLSHMCNVTANQRSTVKLSAVQSGVNCSMEEKVIVAVCDSRSSII